MKSGDIRSLSPADEILDLYYQRVVGLLTKSEYYEKVKKINEKLKKPFGIKS